MTLPDPFDETTVYGPSENGTRTGGIEILLNTEYGRRLVGTEYATKVTIVWNVNADGYANSPLVVVRAYHGNIISPVKQFYELDIMGALLWVYENTI